MKTILNPLEDVLRVLLLALVALLAIESAEAQIGTYVTPRPYTVYNSFVTNGQSITFYGTNYLNYSGYHNVNWFLSEYGTNNIGTNLVGITIAGSFGSGNNYTNPAAGTNYLYTGTLIAWTNAPTVATNTTTPAWTNITQSLGDGMLLFKGTATVTCTNAGGFWLQIDEVITP